MRARALSRAALLTSVACGTALAVPWIRARIVSAFVQITHTAVHTEHVGSDLAGVVAPPGEEVPA
jgi:hypothetical protein